MDSFRLEQSEETLRRCDPSKATSHKALRSEDITHRMLRGAWLNPLSHFKKKDSLGLDSVEEHETG